ncbi:MAG: hypothetical protein M1376_10300 [Planctomycetes bacterium]|nr:hypothetical protein [Planctomycetota bacterium]
MSRTELQGRSRLNESTGVPGGGGPRPGSLSRAQVVSMRRFCAVMVTGLIILAGLAGTSHAQSGNTRKSSNQVEAGVAPGIRDPMNPQAYMQDLASRMDSRRGQGLLLNGVSAPRVGSAPTGPTVPATFGTAPRVSPPQAAPRTGTLLVPGTSVQPAAPRVPTTGVWNVTPPVRQTPGATPRQPDRVVPNTFAITRAPAGKTPAAAPEPTSESAPAASAPTPTPGTQTLAAAPGQLIQAAPTASASAVIPAPGAQTAAAPGQLIRDMPMASASAVLPAPAAQTPTAAPGQLVRDMPTASAVLPAPGPQTPAAASGQLIRDVLTPSSEVPAPHTETSAAAPGQLIQDMPTVSAVVPAPGTPTAATPGQLVRDLRAASATVPAPGSQAPAATPGQLVQVVPNVPRGTLAPAPQTTLILPGQEVPLPPAVAPALIGNPMSPAYPAVSSTDRLYTRGPGSVERQLIAGRPGLTLWSEPGSVAAGGAPAAPAPEPEGPWTLGGDLEKYRAHAVKDGSRNSGENLKKALERTGMTLGDGVNVFVLGYASDRAKPFRQNDGKGLLEEPGRVPAAAGATIGNLGVGLYSLADLLTLNALPDPNTPAYTDNNPLVRPVVFAGRTIHGAWKTTEEVGNAVTWGLFDNVTGCIGLVIEDIVEVMKHAGEAVTNVARVPFHLAADKKNVEGTDRALDWVLLVPLELASNAVEMKGVANMQDYKTAFREKGVIGSVLEFGGSTYIAYRAVDKLVDKAKDEFHHDSHSGGHSGGNSGGGGQNPPDTDIPDSSSDIWFFWNSDGTIIRG